MSRNTVHEGWLTKSPPNRRIWRTRWRRRWFSLRQSGELPGQYFLDYYADRNCRRLKGTINLDLCEQVDAGLRIERQSHAPFNPKIRGSVFTIQTQRRTYHLQADCESEMEKWVDAICRVCGLRSTQDSDKVEAVEASPPSRSVDDNDVADTLPPGAIQLVVVHSGANEYTADPQPGSGKVQGQQKRGPCCHLAADGTRVLCYAVVPQRTPSGLAAGLRLDNRSRSADPILRGNAAACKPGPSRQTDEPQPGPSSKQGPRPCSKPGPGPSSKPGPSPIFKPRPGPSAKPASPDIYPNSSSSGSSIHNHYECLDGTGPYIPISECITGVRAMDEQRAFTFDPKNIVISTRHDSQQLYSSQTPFVELSDNESNLSDEEEMSLHASHQNIHWSVTKSFTKLSVSKKNGGSGEGPPVPPRPPKTLYVNREALQKETYQGPKIQEPLEPLALDNAQQQRARVPRRMSQGGPSSPARMLIPLLRTTDDEEESSPGHSSLQYCNLPSLPPAVDRALKPRHSSVSVGHISAIVTQGGSQQTAEELKPDVLQYLDLDLTASKPTPSKGPEKRKVTIVTPGKSPSAVEADSAYKTVDFLKTEAFNITRQDAEASRSFQY